MGRRQQWERQFRQSPYRGDANVVEILSGPFKQQKPKTRANGLPSLIGRKRRPLTPQWKLPPQQATTTPQRTDIGVRVTNQEIASCIPPVGLCAHIRSYICQCHTTVCAFKPPGRQNRRQLRPCRFYVCRSHLFWAFAPVALGSDTLESSRQLRSGGRAIGWTGQHIRHRARHLCHTKTLDHQLTAPAKRTQTVYFLVPISM
jgi:hypothetical protein